ncbi:hypothetical protein [Pseudomonas triticifolii]|uniref:Transcriptional regulator n=1 Tax=Pseudomonas triticifolii TaxID=2762592 RepID=A0ABR7BKI7_9PSED|nr:hypothetical protein [Pseudomonas triticifolii]MBC3957698.1 hypothetical protein [Pseudomonas triticifolii]
MSEMAVMTRDTCEFNDAQQSVLSNVERQVIQGFRLIPDDEKRRVLRLIDLLIDHPDTTVD